MEQNNRRRSLSADASHEGSRNPVFNFKGNVSGCNFGGVSDKGALKNYTTPATMQANDSRAESENQEQQDALRRKVRFPISAMVCFSSSEPSSQLTQTWRITILVQQEREVIALRAKVVGLEKDKQDLGFSMAQQDQMRTMEIEDLKSEIERLKAELSKRDSIFKNEVQDLKTDLQYRLIAMEEDNKQISEDLENEKIAVERLETDITTWKVYSCLHHSAVFLSFTPVVSSYLCVLCAERGRRSQCPSAYA
jgi:hypothetical protein